MKKMNKMYEAPKAETIELNVDANFMDHFIGASVNDPDDGNEPEF